jgi:ribosomal protein S18 acetylase RimI-like enzyme
VLVRPARREDSQTIICMLADLASWEGGFHPPRLDSSVLDRDVFGIEPKLHILVAENPSKQLVGLISYYVNYSSWEGTFGVHIGDLWVSPVCRSQGIGSALLNKVTTLYEKRRMDVFVIQDNEARFFYERLGFKEQTQWTLYRKDAKCSS